MTVTVDSLKNRKLSVKNKSGYSGIVAGRNNTWLSRIHVNNRDIHIGVFKTLKEAVEARIIAEEEYFGESFTVWKGDR